MNGRTDRQTDRTDGQTGKRMDGKMKRWGVSSLK